MKPVERWRFLSRYNKVLYSSEDYQVTAGGQLKSDDSICTNGPAIWEGCVAERMKAGAENMNRGRILVPAGMNEAWRTFCRPGTNFIELYAYRGTKLISGREFVPI